MEKKDKILIGVGVFGIIGFFAMLGEEIAGAIFFLLVGLVCLFLSRDAIFILFTGKPIRKKGESDDDFNNRVAKMKAEKEEKARKQAEQKRLDNIEKAKWKNIVVGKLSVNEEDNKVKINNMTYYFNDIIGCDVVQNEDSISITKTTGENQKKVAVGKALVGGFFLGTAGTIIGGTSGKTKINQTSVTENQNVCNKLEVKVKINNIQQPIQTISFINTKVYANSPQYSNAVNNVEKCVGALEIIINRNN